MGGGAQIGLPALGVDALLIVLGLIASGFAWWRLTRGERDFQLGLIYFFGLFGALAGAKVAFLVAEGWFYRDDWVALATGRSITGAILGGYAGVEWGKRQLGYPRTTGDLFAIVVPLALVIGRAHSVSVGCCPGMACGAHWWVVTDANGVMRWPAAWVEMGFNVAFLAWALLAMLMGWARENRFHVYMVAYGMFRFAHEFARDDHRVLGPLTGYHFIAVALAVVGAWRWVVRSREITVARGQEVSAWRAAGG